MWTPEELAKLAEVASTPGPEAKAIDDVDKYILSKNIKAGSEFIFTRFVYQDYVAWSENPVGRQLFSRTFNIKFKPRQGSNHSYYGYDLDPSSFDLSQDNQFRMRNNYYNAKRKKQRQEQAKPNKISRAREGS